MMKTIENSPIYNMSMCSLENFHTCFINWLGNAYPVETLKLFMPDKNADNIKFKKQIKHNSEYIFDLCVTIGNNNEEFLVIENKLKSFPTEEQLINYNNAFEGKNATFVLLSLAPEVNLPKNWKYLSYSELAKRMHKLFDNIEFLDEYHKYLVADYISVIETLSSSFPQSNSMKYDFYNEKISDDLKDVYIKYRTSELCNFINKTANLSTTVDFRDKQGILNIWCDFKDYDITFLIQIQHNEYRYCLIYGDETENELRESIAGALVKSGIWFNNCIEDYPKARNYQSKKFCGYKPNFIYRYQTLEKIFNKNKLSDISYQEIAKKVNKDISALQECKHKVVKILVDSL